MRGSATCQGISIKPSFVAGGLAECCGAIDTTPIDTFQAMRRGNDDKGRAVVWRC